MPTLYTYKPTGQQFTFEDGVSPTEAAQRISDYIRQQQASDADLQRAYLRATNNSIAYGAKKAFSALGPTLEYTGSALAGAVGAKDTQKRLAQAAGQNMADLQQRMPELYSSFSESPTGYLGESLGGAAPDLALMLGTGATAGGLRALAGRGALSAAEAAAGTDAAQEAALIAARNELGKSVGRYTMAGQGAASFATHAGQNYEDYINRQGIDNASPYAALGAAALQAPLDVWTGGRLLHSLEPAAVGSLGDEALESLANGSRLREMGRNAATNAAREAALQGGIGGAQTAIQYMVPYGAGALSDPDVQQRILESMGQGALLGGTVGGATGAFGGMRRVGAASEELGNRNARKQAAEQAQTEFDLSQTTPNPLEAQQRAQAAAEAEALTQGVTQHQAALKQAQANIEAQREAQLADQQRRAQDLQAAQAQAIINPNHGDEIHPVQQFEPFEPGAGIAPAETRPAETQEPSPLLQQTAPTDAMQALRNRSESIAQTGNDLLFPEVPYETKPQAIEPTNAPDAAAAVQAERAQMTLPGVAPRFLDEANAGLRSQYIKPFNDAGIKDWGARGLVPVTKYAREAAKVHDDFFQGDTDLSDPATRTALADRLNSLNELAQRPESGANNVQRGAIKKLATGNTLEAGASPRPDAESVKPFGQEGLFSRPADQTAPADYMGKEPTDTGLQSLIQSNAKLSDALQYVKQTGSPEEGRLADRLTQTLGPLLDQVTTSHQAPEGGPANAMGQYTATGGQGRVGVFPTAFTAKRGRETVMHEAVHAATAHAYETDPIFRRRVDKLRDEARDVLGARGVQFDRALNDGHEFLAEGMTNPTFRDSLRQSTQGRSLWQRFKGAVRDLMNRLIGQKDAGPLVDRIDSVLDGYKAKSLGETASPKFSAPAEGAKNIPERDRTGTGDITKIRADRDAVQRVTDTAYKTAAPKIERALAGTNAVVKKVATQATDFRTLADTFQQVVGKHIPELGNPLKRILDISHQKAAVAEGVRQHIIGGALNPLRDLRKADPKGFDGFQRQLVDMSYARFDPARAAEPGYRDRAVKFAGEDTVRRLETEYSRMTPAQKAAATKVFTTMRESLHDMTTGLAGSVDRIVQEVQGDPTTSAARSNAVKDWADTMRQNLKSFGAIDPYIPFGRHGDFMVSYTTSEGIPGMLAFETRQERDRIAQQMAGDKSFGHVEGFNRYENPQQYLTAVDRLSNGMASRLQQLKREGFTSADTVIDDMIKTIGEVMTTKSSMGAMLEKMQNRKNYLGASTDLLRSLSQYSQTAGRAQAAVRLGGDMGRAWRDLGRVAGASAIFKTGEGEAQVAPEPGRIYLPADVLAKVQPLIAEAMSRRDFIENPTYAPWASTLAKWGFNTMLGLNPSSAFMQVAQLSMVQAPILHAHYGDGAFSAMFDAATKVATGRNSLMKFLRNGDVYRLAKYDPTMFNADGSLKATADATAREFARLRDSTNLADRHRAIMVEMVRRGMLSDFAAGEVSAMAKGANPDSLTYKVDKIAGFMMREAENFNRAVSATAAYNMLTKNGRQAVDWASTMDKIEQNLYEGHGDYSSANSPKWFQSNFGRVALLFKKFAFHSWTQMLRYGFDAANSGLTKQERLQAAQKLGGIMLMSMTMAGAAGLPLFGAAKTAYYLWQQAFGDDDETRDLDIAMRQSLDDAGTGETARNLIMNGLPSLLGINLTNRLGFADMLFRDPGENLDSTGAAKWAAETALGPWASIGERASRAVGKVADGQTMAGIADLMPAAGVRNVLRSYIQQNEGGVVTARGDRVADTDAIDNLLQVVGFQPLNVGLQAQINTAAKAIDTRISQHRNDILRRYRLGYATGDDKMMDDAANAAQQFNEFVKSRGGDSRLMVEPRDFDRSVQTMTANNAFVVHGMRYGRYTKALSEDVTALSPQ